ncbi:phosphodiester glycosidase family protein [Actinomadura parmotrematis]|uniref:Phosphodiester glycosidase family protein n=1 Tax=Actinomadura parmotrematis TaxID=2864039 RepID=A0ABS7FWX4_9ACTN|nr:phosphodiester glycosidase family protein [Actinomadura parmotrematis]MBW8484485.1 phosphodiester glycosidase family protein [Actinomadura parmotrematis]
MLLRTVLTLSLLSPAHPAVPDARQVTPGAVWRPLAFGGARGSVLEVDLRRARLGLLRPPRVASRLTTSAMVRAAGALAGVNGDFFHISERQHPGVPATGAPVGPEVANGVPVKGPVPLGQRYGPDLPAGAPADTVIGTDAAGRGRVFRLALRGRVRIGGRRLPVAGLNQYALPAGGVGVFTPAWGAASRARAFCGDDRRRGADCTPDTAAVTVRGGRVTGLADPGGELPAGTVLLAGREDGAAPLRAARVGDPVAVSYRLAGRVRPRFALGGLPVLRDGAPLGGLPDTPRRARTVAGVSADGRRVYLAVVDGARGAGQGLSLAGAAALLRRLHADDGVALDGGGSSTMVVRLPGEGAATVRNHPSDSRERPVANGIGVFAAR